jgi:hypothetical protein
VKGTFFGTGGEACDCEEGWPLQRVEKREEDMIGIRPKERDREDLCRELFGLRMKERRAMKPASKCHCSSREFCR